MPTKKKVEEVLEKEELNEEKEQVFFGPWVKITKTHKDSKIEETLYGFDLFFLQDVELMEGLTKNAETGIMIEVPFGYVGLLSLDDDLASGGVVMLNSPFVVGKKEMVIQLRTLNDWFMPRKGRKLATVVFVKGESLNTVNV